MAWCATGYSGHSKTHTAVLSLPDVFLRFFHLVVNGFIILLQICKKKKRWNLMFYTFLLYLYWKTNLLLLWQINGPLAVLHCIWLMVLRVTKVTGHSQCNFCLDVSHVKWCVHYLWTFWLKKVNNCWFYFEKALSHWIQIQGMLQVASHKWETAIQGHHQL